MDIESTRYTLPELMVTAAAREIVDGEIIFVGMRLPLLGFLLAKSTHAPNAVGIYELGVIRDSVAPEPILTMGDLPNFHRAQWLADMTDMMGLLQKGEVDASFIGGAQVDRFGNLNTTYIANDQSAPTRMPGSGGACDLACLAGRHIIIMNHEKRRFVPRVDYITSPGYGDGPGWRNRMGLPRGGPCAVITTLGVLRFDPDTMEMVLAGTHPGVTVDQIQDNTGWPIKMVAQPSVTAEPTEAELSMLRRFDPKGFWTGR
jgi:glutaconate CoA-transferase, subunit B